ncbi:MAG: cell division protein FtsL [Candidatus Cloacimonetes bacterium]|nr:cell division protein FtsL [Candidatus Cloacimonadota bacterium]
MKIKWLLLMILLIFLLFSHYYNKHRTILYERQYEQLVEARDYLKAMNSCYLATNYRLGSRIRIEQLATEKLGMFFPLDNSSLHLISFDSKKQNFCLIDYIIPPVEALTSK